MRKLTFCGFLEKYISELSINGNTGFYKLSRESEENPRLREPLMLYALYSGKSDVLLKATKSKERTKEYRNFFKTYSLESVESEMRTGSMPVEFQKVWNSYSYQLNCHNRDNETKCLMRKRILKLQKEKGVTNYRLYTELNLNPGNINAWLKHNDVSKLSLKTARVILQYLEDLQ